MRAQTPELPIFNVQESKLAMATPQFVNEIDFPAT